MTMTKSSACGTLRTYFLSYVVCVSYEVEGFSCFFDDFDDFDDFDNLCVVGVRAPPYVN